MFDSNVIFSALAYPESNISKMVEYIKQNHSIILSQYIINETERTIFKKRNEYYEYFKLQLDLFSDEIVNSTEINISKYPQIRDVDDIPILASAIIADIDILITGDTDFDDVVVDKPRIMKPRQFQDEYMNV